MSCDGLVPALGQQGQGQLQYTHTHTTPVLTYNEGLGFSLFCCQAFGIFL